MTYQQYEYAPAPTRDPDDLAKPLYGASFGEATVRFVKNTFRYSGRASRSEFWWAALAQFLLFVAFVVFGALGAAVESNAGWAYTVFENLARVAVLAYLLSVVPLIALAVRRLHDSNNSGWWLLCVFIPFFGGFTGLVVGLLNSEPAGIRFDKA